MSTCLHKKRGVISTRMRKDGRKYRRVECHACGFRWSTAEIEAVELQGLEKVAKQIELLREVLSRT